MTSWRPPDDGETGPALTAAPRIPRATYRVQLNAGLRFAAARELVPYLAELGVSDLYTSPFLKARPGSTHGYDIVDHNALNPEIGTREELSEMTFALQSRGMGLLVDFVPNHMGIGPENAWWMDVLENGQSSLFSAFFDIDWSPLGPQQGGKVVLPMLGDHYGRVLEDGQLQVFYDGGAFFVRYYEHVLPLSPRTYVALLEPAAAELAETLGPEREAVLELLSVNTGFTNLPPRTETRRAKAIERGREKEILKRRMAALMEASPEVDHAVRARIARVNGDRSDPRSFDLLHALLEEQAYRLSFWRVAAEEINYRRFFDVNELAAIRMENPAVFNAAHRLLFELVARREVTGIRVDHPDGLWDPASYFERLQEEHARILARRSGAEEVEEARQSRPSEPRVAVVRTLYVVVEKILARGEELPPSWAIHGTSGYEFASAANALFVDGAADAAMTEIYGRFVGERIDFQDLIYDKKLLILETSMAGELGVLSHVLKRLAEKNRHSRDFTLGALARALREIIACFPVYRTYVRERSEGVDPRDRAAVQVAVRLARRKHPTTDASLYDFMREILLEETPPSVTDEDRALRREFVMRLQQLTGPVMAKGLEDTAFYLYNRLVSLNEVGGEPEHFGGGVREFHRLCEERQATWPHSMNATSTHDTKRSEDVRARISVLSELPDRWADALAALAEATEPLKSELEDRIAPDPNEEYLFYQTVIGTWPGPGAPPADYADRLAAYMRKATKEAKVNTSWINAHPGWDAAVEAFVRGAVAPGSAFLERIAPLARAAAFFGRWNGLAQVLLKMVSPGVPDLYQGTELWDDSLVDPDNRRPVDFEARRAVLADVIEGRRRGRAFAEELVQTAEDGRIKMFVTHVALSMRAKAPRAFGDEGAYAAVAVVGKRRRRARGGVREARSGARDHRGRAASLGEARRGSGARASRRRLGRDDARAPERNLRRCFHGRSPGRRAKRGAAARHPRGVSFALALLTRIRG